MNLCSFLIAFVFAACPVGTDPSIDFKTDILPIFQRHCLQCHGSEDLQGELNLETLNGVRTGGHSGSPLLAKKLDQSELYLRVTSTTPGYRMPKKGEPLSADELETLAAWIQKTSPVVKANLTHTNETISNPNATEAANSEPVASMIPGLDSLKPGQRYRVIGVLIAIALLLLYLIVRAIQTRNKYRRENLTHESGSSKSPLGWMFSVLIGATLCVALIGFSYYFFVAAQLSQQVEDLTANVARLQPKTVAAKPIGLQNLPLPPYPMHPPRLGGRYYRGNDERDPALFNGGFYRTATIDLQLIDAEGDPVQWEDDASGELFIEIKIERAPQATRELFTERVRSAVSLQHFNRSSQIDGDVSRLEVIEEQQLWRAVIELPKKRLLDEGQTEGMVYIMFGVDHAVKSATGAATPRPHFGIRYEVAIEEGKIASTSTLWMGSMYTLGGRVLVPNKDQVLLDRWFDWRPIPVIEGEGSSDPKLLGLPEHLQNKQDSDD